MVDASRAGRYQRIQAQLEELIVAKSPSRIAAMATIAAVLHAKMPHHSWTGFYLSADEQTLHVGPYQGPVACQVLAGKGVCLHCARTRQPVVVPDVEQFPGHIACDSRTKSEICLPVLAGDRAVAVLDIDSHRLAQFDQDDVAPLQRIVNLLAPWL